ncbi:MAG: hypothetical protein AB7G11_11575 [Phycisphaerales bacterium]
MKRVSVAVASMLGVSGCVCGHAWGDIYRFTVQSASSQISTDVSATTALTGSLIGNFDAVSNPTGTRTIPGLIGGDTTGNYPIPISGTAGFSGADTTHPAGQFTFNLDTELLTATVAGLSLDMLSGAPIGVTLGLVVQWDTFRTRQPTSVFLGGIPIPIPFGQVQLSMLTLSQTELTGVGLVTENGPGEYSVALIAPVTVMGQIDVLGTMQAIGPFTIPLPLQVEVTTSGNTATARFGFDAEIQQEIPFMVDLPADQAIDLPTVLPPGSAAHLLLNGSVEGIALDVSLGSSVMASGERQARNPADWNNDGIVNSLDFMAFMVDFFLLSADFNADTRTNSQDFYDFMGAYFGAR